MRLLLVLFIVVLAAGCTASPPAGLAPLSWPACGGTFADGLPVHCDQKATEADVELTVPAGWVLVTDFGSNDHDRQEFYRSPTFDAVGYRFQLTTRSEGDFASPHPTRYGGVLRVEDGPLVAWDSARNAGFIRYPLAETRPTWALEPLRVHVLVYVPVVNAVHPELANATMTPLWAAGTTDASGDDPFRAVLQVVPARGEPLLLHDGQPGVERLGQSLRHPNLGQFHIYQIFSGSIEA